MNMTVINRKNVAAEIEVRMSTFFGDNLKITWNTNSVELIRHSSNEYRWNFMLEPEEELTIEWNENYRR